MMSPLSWRELLVEPGSRRHLVLVHQTDAYLHTCVASWAARALTTRGGAILVGRAHYLQAIARELRLLGVDTDERIGSGRLVLLDAEATLDRLLRDGRPQRAAFRELVASTVSRVRAACGSASADVRAWGEMVSVLQEREEGRAALELEEMWDAFLREAHVSLLCSYRLAGLRDLADACESHAALLVEAGAPIDGTSSRILDQVFGEVVAGSSYARLLARGAIPVGSPPTALLLPLDAWGRPSP